MSIFSNSVVSLTFNTTSGNEEASVEMSRELFLVSWPKWTFQICLALVGLLGNTLIICTFAKKLKTNGANYYILCLAAVDLFACCVTIPLHVFTTANYFSFVNSTTCKLIYWSRASVTACSSILLQATALDRYKAVCKPFTWRKVGAKKTVFVLGVCIFTGFFLSSPLLYISGLQYYVVTSASVESYGFSAGVFQRIGANHSYISVCEILNIYHDSWESRTMSAVSLVVFLILVTTTVISYSAVYIAMRKLMQKHAVRPNPANKVAPLKMDVMPFTEENTRITAKQTGNIALTGVAYENQVSVTSFTNVDYSMSVERLSDRHQGAENSVSRISRTRYNQFKAAKMLLIVTVVFVVSWVPFWIQALLAFIDSSFDNYRDLQYQIRWDFLRELYFLNNALNAVVFYVYNDSFRQFCKKCFRLKRCAKGR